MRNALLILASASLLLALVWWWPRPSPERKATPSAAAPAAPDAAQPTPPPQPAATPPQLNAADLTRRAQARKDTDPAAALADLEQADHLDAVPNSERRALEIVLQVQLGRVGHARALTDRFYRAFPGDPHIPKLERLTGYHPRPYGPQGSK